MHLYRFSSPIIILAFIIALCAPGEELVHAEGTGRARIALVVGVSRYRFVSALTNPANDARAMSAALTRLGFNVDTIIDPDRLTLEAATRRLGQRARGAEAALVFYAGHALEAGGHNWLLPVDANPATERDLRFEALDMDGLLEQLDSAAPVNIVVMDACRDNPFRLRFGGEARGQTPAGGLAPSRAATGTLVAFATGPGMVAEDGSGSNSPFTSSLLRHIELPGVEIRKLMADVRREVREATRGRQIPWEHSALEGDFFFKPAVAAAPTASSTNPLSGSEAELTFWQGVRDSMDPGDLHAFLLRFPEGMFANLARNRLARLDSTQKQTSPSSASLIALDRLILLLNQTGDQIVAPYSAEWGRKDAKSYVGERVHKAIAVEPVAGRTFRRSGLPSAALAEQLALEGCQLSYGAPCVLLSSDDDLRASEPRISPRLSMPRINYAGDFRVDMVPLITASALPDAVNRYAGLTGPKAMALRAISQRISTGTGETASAAERAALAGCNSEPSPVPCFLYASGGHVILSERKTEARPDQGMSP